jgi:hypothetical protein
MVNRNDDLRTAVVPDMVTLSREQRYRGVRLVASVAHDAADCRQLLAALGLDAEDGKAPGEDEPVDRSRLVEDQPDRRRSVGWHDPRSLLERMAASRTGLKAT